MEEQDVRRLLVTTLEYAYLYDDWVFPLGEALEGLTPVQAAWRPSPDAKGIWDIVLHVAVWNENIVERIESGEGVRPQEGAWPELPEVRTEEDWQIATNRLWKSIYKLKEVLTSAPFELIENSPWGFPDLMCRIIHVAYHVGQIAKIREIYP